MMNDQSQEISSIDIDDYYDKLTLIIKKVQSNKLLSTIDWIINDTRLLYEYAFERLYINDKFNMLFSIYKKKYVSTIELNTIDKIIYNLCLRNFIFEKQNKLIIDNTNIKDKPIGMYFAYKGNYKYKIFTDSNYEDATSFKIQKI